jgi:hypothetical protein
MQVTENNQNIEEISVPITACPIEDVRDYSVEVAGHGIDTKDIYDHFKNEDVFTRQDVKDWMKNNTVKGLDDLKKAIFNKWGEKKGGKIMEDVYDEIIDKMVDRDLLKFPIVELSRDFEREIIDKWSKLV